MSFGKRRIETRRSRGRTIDTMARTNATDSKPTFIRAVSKKGHTHYDYSCGIGALAAPSKDNFTRNGEVQNSATTKNISDRHSQ
jgi:hypothetical protein